MAKAVADVNGDDQGGFASDGSNITGFSHMHDSGTGGVSHVCLQIYSTHTNDELFQKLQLVEQNALIANSLSTDLVDLFKSVKPDIW